MLAGISTYTCFLSGSPVGSVRVSSSSSNADAVSQCNDMVKACSRAYDGGFGGGSCAAEINNGNIGTSPNISADGGPSPVMEAAQSGA